MQLEAQLADRGVTFELSPEAVAWLADKGYDSQMGARPLGRVIQEHIKRPLADEVLFGKLQKGGTVKVTVSEDGAGLLLEPVEEKRKAAPAPEPETLPAKKKRKAPAAKAAEPAAKPAPKAGPKKSSVPKVPLAD